MYKNNASVAIEKNEKKKRKIFRNDFFSKFMNLKFR